MHACSPARSSLGLISKFTTLRQTRVLSSNAVSQDSQTMTLPDGRTLGFAEYGTPTGKPIFFFHGMLSSRRECARWDSIATRLNARIISVDRPGVGLSTFQPRRTFLDWPQDVRNLAKHLAIERFRVLGESAGAPHALACVKVLPRELLSGVGLIAGMGPRGVGTRALDISTRLKLGLAAWWPPAIQLMIDEALVDAAQNPDRQVFKRMVDEWIESLGEKDKAVYADETARWSAVDDTRDSLRHGSAGYIRESKMFANGLGFRLEDIAFEPVRLWYGTADEQTPLAMGKHIAARLRNSVLKVYPDETHFTLSHNHAEEILRDILSNT